VANPGTTTEDLINRFGYHPANTEEKKSAHELVRAECLQVAVSWNDALPPGREKSLALTKLEEAMFWANAAHARN
jgi:hypothetical protein